MNKKLSKFLKHNESGQTSVEYILMLAVMVTLITSLMGIAKDRILGNVENCGAGTASLACSLQRIVNFGSNPGDTENNFRYFTLRR